MCEIALGGLTKRHGGSMQNLPIHITFKWSVLKMTFTQLLEGVTTNQVL